jgi:hypothetical protein
VGRPGALGGISYRTECVVYAATAGSDGRRSSNGSPPIAVPAIAPNGPLARVGNFPNVLSAQFFVVHKNGTVMIGAYKPSNIAVGQELNADAFAE